MSDRPRAPGDLRLAPPATACAEVARFPSHHDERPLPAVDDHIVEPETRWEMLDGELIYAEPAEEPHAETHSQLDFIVRGLAAPGYKTASDMLTRTGHRSNFAPDASIYSEERHPVTKGRKLEELAFDVVSEQSRQVRAARFESMGACGARSGCPGAGCRGAARLRDELAAAAAANGMLMRAGAAVEGAFAGEAVKWARAGPARSIRAVRGGRTETIGRGRFFGSKPYA